jgi:hypothetical protein
MKVTHCRDKKFTVYIGRPSVYGNPFIIGQDGTRDDVMRKFKKYALKNERVLKAIAALPKHAILGCYCKPKACHGDVIVKLWKRLHANDNSVPYTELVTPPEPVPQSKDRKSRKQLSRHKRKRS